MQFRSATYSTFITWSVCCSNLTLSIFLYPAMDSSSLLLEEVLFFHLSAVSSGLASMDATLEIRVCVLVYFQCSYVPNAFLSLLHTHMPKVLVQSVCRDSPTIVADKESLSEVG